MKSTTAVRTKRTLIALLLMFVLSFTTAFAATDTQEESPGGTVQTEVSADTGDSSGQDAEVKQEEPAAAAPAPAPVAKTQIIKKGRVPDNTTIEAREWIKERIGRQEN